MYELTLTASERRAFDWVGDRYNAGAIAGLLAGLDGADWNADGDVTFQVPEGVALEIQTIAAEEDYCWPCFGPELSQKLIAFCDQIV